MKKTGLIILAIVVVLIAAPTSVLARGGHSVGCICKSIDMKPMDALIWTFANPNECEMTFPAYSQRIFSYVEEIKKEEIRRSIIISALLQKHVNGLVNELQNGEVHYSGASDHEEYVKLIMFYKKIGFKCDLDDMALQKFLQNKYLQKCTDILKKLRDNKTYVCQSRSGEKYLCENYAELLVDELRGILKKSGLTLSDVKTSEKEMAGFKSLTFFRKAQIYIWEP